MLTLNSVSKVYKTGMFGRGSMLAVNDVSFSVQPGEVVSLIGESGSGKTTIGKMILRLTSVTDGSIDYAGNDIATVSGRALKGYYRSVQGVFQDPFSSYNPIFKADRVLAMVKAEYYPGIGRSEWSRKIESSLQAVSLNPEDVLGKYPHQLSGGQLQRLLIARALLLDIEILVADEVISMLDASTRIDVLNLLGDLKHKGLGILLITHDLALGNYISDSTVILRHGRIVERGATARVFGNPAHEYTRGLLASVPRLDAKWSDEAVHALKPVPTDGAGGPLVEVEEDHWVATGTAPAEASR